MKKVPFEMGFVPFISRKTKCLCSYTKFVLCNNFFRGKVPFLFTLLNSQLGPLLKKAD